MDRESRSGSHRRVSVSEKVTQIRRCFNIGEVMRLSGETEEAARCRRRALQLGGEIISLVDENAAHGDDLDTALSGLEGTDAEMYKNVTTIIALAQREKLYRRLK